MPRRPTRPSHTREELDRLNDASDDLAAVLGVDPERVQIDPTELRVVLSLTHVEALLDRLYPNGQRALRDMANTCHWVEHQPDGDYQCEMSPGHYRENASARALYAHQCTIRLTERRRNRPPLPAAAQEVG